MPSTRKLTDIPPCMRMSFNFPWESSPQKEISDPLSYDLPDLASDLEVIYGEAAAKHLFSPTPSTPTLTKGVDLPSIIQEDSTFAVNFLEPFGPGPTPEPPSATKDSSTSPSGHVNDLDSLLCESPSPSPKRRVSGGKKERKPARSNVRTRRVQCRRRLPTNSPSAPRNPNPDDALAPEFIRNPQRNMPRTSTVGPPSLPESNNTVFHPNRPSNSSAKSSPSRPTRNVNANAPRNPEAFADLYCRFPGCDRHSLDKRTIKRHRLTHVPFSTYVCPNPVCATRTKAQPNFSREDAVRRHLKLAAPDSPCAKMWNEEEFSLRENATLAEEAEGLIQKTLIPFDPAIHIPFYH